jgi:transcriptional regulator with XRE-family HTH domain
MTTITPPAPPLGDLLKAWRARRRMSQLDLASQAGVSSRHLSFVETGKSRPSREMVLHLAEHLDVPLRERNTMLIAAGFAPAYRESTIDEPELVTVRRAIDVMLANHEPMPALVVDRVWNVVAANAGLGMFLGLLSPDLPDSVTTNAVRVSLHPDALAPRIDNFEEYTTDLLDRLRRQVDASRDPELTALLEEVSAYPNVAALDGATPERLPSVVLPLRLRLDEDTLLSFFTTMTVFGAPLDVTLSELAVECFFPADAATDDAVRRIEMRSG